METWITDTEISERFTWYTRANADEVGPDPFSPLGWSLGWNKGCVPGVAQGFVDFGVIDADELTLDPPEVFGNWGGYFYNQLSLPRVMGARMPGATPAAIDQAYFGDHPGVPVYEPHPDDESPAHEAKLGETMGWAMSTNSFPAQEEMSAQAKAAVHGRPDLALLSNEALVGRAREMTQMLCEGWVVYCQSVLAASLGPGAVQAICAAIGRESDAVKVMTAIGGVESAQASFVMWDMSRSIKNSPTLMEAFDAGTDDLLERLAASDDPAAVDLLSQWSALLADHGHRGPNEWDMRAHSWTTKPTLALGMLDRLRHQSNDRSPHDAQAKAATERESLTAELLAIVEGDPEAHGTLAAGIKSASVFFQAREMGKNVCIRAIHEAKLAMMELGDRMVAQGVIADPQQIFMLLESELDDFLADPGSYGETIASRDADFAHLHELEPPYIVGLEGGVPPISEWAPRNAGGQTLAVASEVLQGAGGAPGEVTGVARIVLDPSDPMAVDPGDIMIAPTTDPSWTPLFLSAAGVVVNVGAVASHAAIVCRELGVPCVVSVVDATSRIPDGATISIDGSTGTVTIISL